MVEVDGGTGHTTWWTFAGLMANSQLTGAFTALGTRPDNLSITINQTILPRHFQEQLEADLAGLGRGRVDQADAVKFQECLPEQLLLQMQASRSSDARAVKATKTASLIFRDVQ